jgi:hypothetical protein
MRRLITLISAGRNRIIVIRRELPRTEDAGWAKMPYRTKARRVLRSVRPRPVSVRVATKSIIESPKAWRPQPAIPSSKISVLQRRRVPSRPREARRREALTGGAAALGRDQRGWQAHCSRLSSRALLLPSLFRLNRNCPDEAQQFAADRGDNLRFVLSFGKQLFVAGTQPPLRLPSDGFSFFIQPLLPLCQPAANPRFVLIGPRRFNNHTSKVRIAGFRYTAMLDSRAAGMLAGHHPAVAHQLPRIAESGQGTDFGDDTNRNDLAYTSQRLQSFNHILDLRRRSGNRIIDRFL